MKELIESLIISEKERTRRFTEFIDYLTEIITTIPPGILEHIQDLKASKYMYGIPWKKDAKDFSSWWIEFTLDDLLWWKSRGDLVVIKKSGLSDLKEDLEVILKVVDLKLKYYLEK